MSDININIAIIGKGPVGMLAALALAKKSTPSCIVGKSARVIDKRTTAIMMPGIRFLQQLQLWQELEPFAAPLQAMRIIDETNRPLRSREIFFTAAEIGEKAFGYNIPNEILNNTLDRAISSNSAITVLESNVISYDFDKAAGYLENGQIIRAKLFIAADGKNSVTRQALNIKTSITSHNQVAFVTSFTHEYEHDNISTEIHTDQGPFTQVPLIGKKSSLIWTVAAENAAAIQKLEKEDLEKYLQEKMHAMLGAIKLETELQAWPLSSLIANELVKHSVLLIGEAAHSFPPIGAQGLNLSLRDIEALYNFIEHEPDIAKIAIDYTKNRKADIKARAMAVALLNNSLSSNILLWQIMRFLGFELLHNNKTLRSNFMREGLAPSKKLLALLHRLL